MAMLPSPYEIHLLVGEYRYYLNTDDLLDHPDSYFSHILKDEWIKDKTAVLTLDRNGKVFRYVYTYMLTGHIDPVRILSLTWTYLPRFALRLIFTACPNWQTYATIVLKITFIGSSTTSKTWD